MTPIGTLKLDTTTRDMLVDAGIKTVEDLVDHPPSWLRRLPNFARRHLNDVKRALGEKGLTLTEG